MKCGITSHKVPEDAESNSAQQYSAVCTGQKLEWSLVIWEIASVQTSAPLVGASKQELHQRALADRMDKGTDISTAQPPFCSHDISGHLCRWAQKVVSSYLM